MLKGFININNTKFEFNLSKPIDISIPLGRSKGPNAFFLSKPVYETVEAGNFIGNVARGGSCNCENIFFNPHGDGTHTECAGHVAEESIYINDSLKQFFFLSRLITITPIIKDGDEIITPELIEQSLRGHEEGIEAVIVRTLPNSEDKKITNYSGENTPYFDAECMTIFNNLGIKHILTDLPSFDKEDNANLTAHKTFFGHPEKWNTEKTLTEMIFVPDTISDNLYLLNLQIASFETDASPSKPILYKLNI